MNWSLDLINRAGARVTVPFLEVPGLLVRGFQPVPHRVEREGEGAGAVLLDLSGCGLGDCVAALPAARWLAGEGRPLWVHCPAKAAFLFADLGAARVISAAPPTQAEGWVVKLDAEAALQAAMYASRKPLSGRVCYNPVETLCELAGCKPALPCFRPAARLEGEALCRLARRSPDRYTVVCQVHSASAEKDWPEPRWAELQARLELSGCNVYYSSEPETVEELAALLAVADLVVAPDSLCFHLAAAIGTPCVGLFGPTDGVAMARWYPLARPLQEAVGLGPLPVDLVESVCLEELGCDAVTRRHAASSPEVSHG